MKHVFAALLFLTIAGPAAAQGSRVVGIVKDETGQPIKGATLSLENPDAIPRNFTATLIANENGLVTLPYLNNLDQIEGQRVTLVALPLKLVGAEASPVRAVVLQ